MHTSLSPLLPQVVARLKSIPGVVDIDPLLIREPGKRADYLADNGSVIIEQKELQAYAPKYPKKFEPLMRDMAAKYGQDPATGMVNLHRLSEADFARVERVLLEDVDVLKDRIHQANKQIQGTKEALTLPDAAGLLLVVTEASRMLVPQAVYLRVHSAISLRKGGDLLYPHVDAVLFVSRANGFRWAGRTRFHLAIAREENPALRFANRLRAELIKDGADPIVGVAPVGQWPVPILDPRS